MKDGVQMGRITKTRGRCLQVFRLAGLVAAGALLSPLATPAAHAATGPSYTTSTVTTTFSTNLRNYTFKYTKPVVTGIKASVKNAIDAKVDAFFKSAISARVQADKDCDPSKCAFGWSPSFGGTTSGGLYQRRYLSVYLEWDIAGRKDPMGKIGTKWLNIDVETGKSVKMSTFVRTGDRRFAYAVGVAIEQYYAREDGDCWKGQLCADLAQGSADPRGRGLSSWLDPDGWTINAKGVTVYYRSAGWTDRYLVKWSRITKPTQRLVTTTTKNVVADQDGGVVTVTQVGRVVAAYDDHHTWVGIRPTGSRTAYLFAEQRRGEEGWTDYIPGYSVRFKSAGSAKAVRAYVD